MEIILLFGISILPALFLLWYYDRYDSSRPEPRRMLWKAFKWGIILTFVAGILEQNLFDYATLMPGQYARAFFVSFCVAALVEESLKLLIVRKIIWKSKHFNEVMDGIIYAVAASLGFATLENLFYVFEGGIEIGIARALLSVPAHALFTGIMGYYLGKAKLAKLPWLSRNIAIKGFLLAVLYHGLFDFFLMVGPATAFLVVPLLILMFFQLKHKIRLARFEDGVSKQKPLSWTFKRITRFAFGILLIIFGIYYSLGISMIVKTGAYQNSDIFINSIVLLLTAGGIFWALRHHVLPKEDWKKQVKIDKDTKASRKISKN